MIWRQGAILLMTATAVACGGRGRSGPADPNASAPPTTTSIKLLEVGERAPAFSVPSITTPPGNLGITPGKVTLVMFWATWNGPCKKSFPKLQALYDRFKDRGLAIAALSVDDAESKPQIAEFAQQNGAAFPIGHDKDHHIGELYRPPHMPTFFIVDRKGILRFVHGGYRDDDVSSVFTPEIEGLLK